MILGHEGEILLVEGVTTAIFALVAFLVGAVFGPRIKAMAEAIGMADCPQCHGEGNIACPKCDGKGSVAVEVDVTVPCKACQGSKKVSITCPVCQGRKTITRTARVQQIGPVSRVRWEWGLLKGIGHWQDVTVGATNVDQQLTGVQLSVQLQGGGSDGAALQIAPNGSETRTFTFKIHGDVAYPVSVGVAPGTVTVPCDNCTATGSVLADCPTCGGTGKVGEKQPTQGPCPDCSKSGKVECNSCKGKGKVSRV